VLCVEAEAMPDFADEVRRRCNLTPTQRQKEAKDVTKRIDEMKSNAAKEKALDAECVMAGAKNGSYLFVVPERVKIERVLVQPVGGARQGTPLRYQRCSNHVKFETRYYSTVQWKRA